MKNSNFSPFLKRLKILNSTVKNIKQYKNIRNTNTSVLKASQKQKLFWVFFERKRSLTIVFHCFTDCCCHIIYTGMQRLNDYMSSAFGVILLVDCLECWTSSSVVGVYCPLHVKICKACEIMDLHLIY